jgi:RNA polymerase sigma factor (sigma-70 family)
VQDASRDGLIDELYNANYAAVLRVCSRILRNPEDAADAAQQVFVIALESLDLSARQSAARAWLLTVARNHCLDLLRRRKRLGKALVTLGPDAGRGTDMETAVADRDFVGVVFKQLSKRERQALWQSAVESRPLGDIAGRLRLSYMAAAQVLHRARRHAVAVATRVAVVFGVFQLGRQRTGGALSLAATRLATVAVVPLIIVAVQGSSPQTPHPNPPPQGGKEMTAPLLQGGREMSRLLLDGGRERTFGGVAGAQVKVPSVVTNQDSLVPGSTATLNSAIDTVRQLIGPLPLVPPVVGKPAALPSVPALPLPTSVPGLP